MASTPTGTSGAAAIRNPDLFRQVTVEEFNRDNRARMARDVHSFGIYDSDLYGDRYGCQVRVIDENPNGFVDPEDVFVNVHWHEVVRDFHVYRGKVGTWPTHGGELIHRMCRWYTPQSALVRPTVTPEAAAIIETHDFSVDEIQVNGFSIFYRPGEGGEKSRRDGLNSSRFIHFKLYDPDLQGCNYTRIARIERGRGDHEIKITLTNALGEETVYLDLSKRA